MDLTQFAEPTARGAYSSTVICWTCKQSESLPGKRQCLECGLATNAKRNAKQRARRATSGKWVDKANECPRCKAPTRGDLCAGHKATLAEIMADPGYRTIGDMDDIPWWATNKKDDPC